MSTQAEMGRLYRELVIGRTPDLVVEFGTAFGASGMWWLSGLEATGRGRLLTFDPNDIWRSLAEANLSAVGSRYTAVAGTFEDKVNDFLGEEEKIDLAFIDAIHTSEFVNPQFELVAERCAPGAVIVLDDIDFSQDMQNCWLDLASDPRVIASLELGRRVGIVELVP